MNLIQVQERLKDLPLQAIMAYANGMNPEVPPYLALGEMQRRKRLEQNPVEPPTGTVKDQLEQQAGLAALQNMRMQQAQQQMMQGAAAQPMPVPEGAPQPEMQPEATGIANAAAQPGVMQPDVLSMAGGGIVAFNKAGLARDDEDDEDDDEDDDEEEQGAKSFPVEDRPVPQGRDIEGLVPIGPAPLSRQPEFAPIGPAPSGRQPEFEKLGPGLRVPPQLAQAIQAPQTPPAAQPAPQGLAGLQALAAQRRGAAPQAPVMATRESMARENPAMYGVLNKPVGAEYLAGLEAAVKAQAAQDPAALEQLQRNKRMDLFRSMIAAGEATRGQKGLGGLLGGFGKSMIPAMEARAEEEAKIKGQATERQMLLNKAKFEIERLQLAQANNDLKTVNAEKAKLFKTAVDAYVSGNALLGKEIAAAAGLEGRKVAAAATEQAARIRAAAKGQGGADKRTDLDKQYQIELDALLAQNFPNDAATRKRAMNIAQDRISKSAGTFRAEITAREKADEWIQSQLFGPKGMQYRKLQRENPAEYKRVMDELELESERRYGVRGSAANIPSTAPTAAPKPAPSSSAPRGTKENPIKLD
jgi:hypothetical protein